MIILITGVPGSGKTLYSTSLILDYIKQGREVYSDINGLKIPAVHPAPEDWRDTPDGSVVVFDECQEKYPADGKGGRTDRPDIAAMEKHRHTGHDIILITQHPNLLHSHIRRLVGRHHHVVRKYGTNRAQIFTQEKAFKVDSKSDLKMADSYFWTYPKANFELYKSATIHTHKATFPRWLKYSAVALVLLVVGVVFIVSNNGMFRGESPLAPVEVAQVNQDSRAQVIQAPPAVEYDSNLDVVVGCISTAKYCSCYDETMTPINMTEAECRTTISQPLSRRIGVGGARSTRAPHDTDRRERPVTKLTLNG